MQHLDGLETEGGNAFEHALACTEQGGGDVQGELVDDAGNQGLPDGGGAPGDVHPLVTGDLRRLRVGNLEAFGDEVERRPTFHLDGIVGVMGEHEHRSVVRRFGPPTSRASPRPTGRGSARTCSGP